MKLEFFLQIFEKSRNIKFYENPLSGSGIIPRGRTDTHRRVGTLIVATIYLKLIQNSYMFRSFTVLQCSQ